MSPRRGRSGAATPIDERELLQRYVPYLRYDSLESYRADSAAVLPEHFAPAGSGWSRTNALKRVDATIVAAARPRPGEARLTLGFLGRSRYENGAQVRRGDYIDAVGRDYVADARRMHADPRHADVCHGHLVRESNGTMWLQYWFFYYNNDKTYFGFGAHEGDWEMIQLRLGADLVPMVATYAQHSAAQAFAWTDLERHDAAGHPVPVVFVARGSHASFARAGEHDLVWPLPPDYADGRGPRIRPRLEVIGSAGPGWALWPGKWGSSDSSPRGPVTKRQWKDPGGFHREHARERARVERARMADPPPPGPRPPRIGVHRFEDRAVVDYRFPARIPAGSARPAWIVVSVDAAEDDLPPSTHAFPVHTAHGVVAHPLPLDDRRYTVRACGYSDDGVASSVVSATLE